MRFLTTMLFLLPLCAQQPSEGPPQGMAPRAPKNLKILKPDEVMPAMRSYTTALGVRCDFCHVQGDRASDDSPHKGTARRMITMVRQVNTDLFEGKQEVTCYTCHRGATEPQSAPPAPAQPGQSGQTGQGQ
jgi:hypothetical protein